MNTFKMFALAAGLLLASSTAMASPRGASGDGKAWGHSRTARPVMVARRTSFAANQSAMVARPTRFNYSPAYRRGR